MEKGGKIKQVFEIECAHVAFDHDRLLKIIELQEGFVSKKSAHTEFFGGALTGVQTVRFLEEDRDKFFDIILETDESFLERELYNLKDEHGQHVIDQSRVRASDVFNIACIYAIHKFHISENLDDEQKELAKTRVCAYLIYKFLTSLLYHYFKYPADPEVAAATYAELSLKYALKQHKSWGATILNLASNMVGPQSVHIDTVKTMSVDYGVERMIIDIQSRIKDMLKNIYAVFMQVHANGGRISVSSSFTEIEGEIEFKDRVSAISKYIRYIKNIIPDKNTFVKPELVAIVTSMMPTAMPNAFAQALNWTSQNYLGAGDNDIDEAIDIVMEHAIDYLSTNRDIARTDIGSVLIRLRGAYTSSRSTDHRLMKARSAVERVVKSATNSKNNNAIAALRTAWMLYIVARALTMRHYSSR
jgi:hypothetical protein